ncbi:restriction endonuclease subunit S, partial [Streptomyces scabiei]
EGVRLSELAQHGAVPSVNQSHLTSMEIPVPPLSAQHRIVRQYEAVLDAADAARATAESLRTLRSNLLTVLLSGEHEIPSSYDALLGEVA